MSPEIQCLFYLSAIVCFLLAAARSTLGTRRPIALGWLGVALVTAVLLVGAVEAV